MALESRFVCRSTVDMNILKNGLKHELLYIDLSGPAHYKYIEEMIEHQAGLVLNRQTKSHAYRKTNSNSYFLLS